MSTTSQDPCARLERFLARRLPGVDVQVSGYEPMHGGYSSEMARFRATLGGQQRWLVVRADRDTRTVSETDRRCEWELLEALTRIGEVPMPDALYCDIDGDELGGPTIILEHIDGESLLAHAARAPAELPALSDRLCELTAEIHAVGHERLPASVSRPASWDAYIDSCIAEWRAAEGEHASRDPVMRLIARWLEEHPPPPAPLTLVHGDVQASNIMVEASGRLAAVDWEFAHVGDPREDLGWLLMTEAIRPPAIATADLAAFCQRYREISGLGDEVVNPDTVAYFSILAAGRAVRGVVRQVRALAEGRNSSMVTAFSALALAPMHRDRLRTMRRLTPGSFAGADVSIGGAS